MQDALPLDILDDVIADRIRDIDSYRKHNGDFTRKRMLDAETAVKVTLNMAGGALGDELIYAFPDADDRMSVSAYIQAKNKLCPELFQDILTGYNKALDHAEKLTKALDYRLFAIDGTDFHPPYQSRSKYAMQTPPGRPRKDGKPVKPCSMVHANMLYDIRNRLFEDCILQPKADTDERKAAVEMLKVLDCGNYIAIMDRGYSCFWILETLNRLKGQGCHYVIRTKSGKKAIKEIAALPDRECDVDMEFHVTTSQRYYQRHKTEDPKLHYVPHIKNHYKEVLAKSTKDRFWDKEDYCVIKCRVVKFLISEPESGEERWEVLFTNLNRFEFPLSSMKDLYHERWGIETAFLQLKYAVKAIQFHSRKDDFIDMEIYSNLIVYNATAGMVAKAHIPQGKGNKYVYKVNFTRAVTIFRKYFRLFNKTPYWKMLSEISMYRIPDIPGRSDERNLKPKSAIWYTYRVG